MKEEVAAVMVQAETRGDGRACSVAKRRSTSALAVLQLLSVLLWSFSTSQHAWVRMLRVAGEGLPQTWLARREAPAMHKVRCRLCTGAYVNLARLPRHFAHSVVWVLTSSNQICISARRQLRGNRSARRCAHV